MRIIFCFLAMTVLFASIASAQTVTAFKSGEQVTGGTKQCTYAFGSNTYTRTIASYQLCPMSIQVNMGPSSVGYGNRPAYPSTVTAFKSGEEITGNTKQCYYSFAGNTFTKTIASYEVCPMSVQVTQ